MVKARAHPTIPKLQLPLPAGNLRFGAKKGEGSKNVKQPFQLCCLWSWNILKSYVLVVDIGYDRQGREVTDKVGHRNWISKTELDLLAKQNTEEGREKRNRHDKKTSIQHEDMNNRMKQVKCFAWGQGVYRAESRWGQKVLGFHSWTFVLMAISDVIFHILFSGGSTASSEFGEESEERIRWLEQEGRSGITWNQCQPLGDHWTCQHVQDGSAPTPNKITRLSLFWALGLWDACCTLVATPCWEWENIMKTLYNSCSSQPFIRRIDSCRPQPLSFQKSLPCSDLSRQCTCVTFATF